MLDVAASPNWCGDGSDIVAVALGGHRARLNIEPETTIADATQRLHEIMSYRAEKVVFVRAEKDVSWEEFVELVDAVWPEANVVSILTRQVALLARRNICLVPSCRDCTKFGGFPAQNR
jgi:hypothetical protein